MSINRTTSKEYIIIFHHVYCLIRYQVISNVDIKCNRRWVVKKIIHRLTDMR